MTLRRGGKRPRPPESVAALLPEIYWKPPVASTVPGEQHLAYGWYLEDLAVEIQSITDDGSPSEVVKVARQIGSSPSEWYRRALAP